MPQPRASSRGARTPLRAAALTPYRTLRARYDDALLTLYERTALPVDDIAAIAGALNSGIYWQLQQLGARARNAKTCRPGVKLRLRRGPRPRPLGNAAAQRAVTAFRRIARLVRAEATSRQQRALDRAIQRATRAAERAKRRYDLVTAQSAYHVGTGLEGLAVLRAKFKAEQPPEHTPEQVAVMRQELARRIEAMIAQREAEEARAKQEAEQAAAATVPPMAGKTLAELAAELGIDEAKARRINEIGEAFYRREEERGPRIRSWD